MQVSVTPQMRECEKEGGEGETPQGGNSGQCLVFHRSANESRGAQTGNSSIVLPPARPGHKSYTATDTQKHMYIQSSPVYRKHDRVSTRMRPVCQTNTPLTPAEW